LPKPHSLPLEAILGTGYARIITYPSDEEAVAKSRIRGLADIGITAIRIAGTSSINGLPVLGKGTVGVVVEAELDGTPIALKIRRTDANRDSLRDEARLLRIANSVNVGPQLVLGSGDYLAMEFIDGSPLSRWVENLRKRGRSTVKSVIRSLVLDCFKLDAIGLDHGELSHAPKNVLVRKSGEPFIVDFESASAARRPSNVTSLMQYFLFGRISKRISRLNVLPRRRTLLRALSAYKQDMSVSSFQGLLESARLI